MPNKPTLSYPVDVAISRVATVQHGLVSWSQVRNMGLTRDQIRHQLAQGRLVAISSTVFRMAGAPETREQRVLAAALDLRSDAVVSHCTAAALWGLPGFGLDPVHVTGRRGQPRRHSQYLGICHQPRSFGSGDVAELDHIRLTTPNRTLFDLAGMVDVHPKRVERALDTALARRLVSIGSLNALLDRLAARGRRGIGLMRELLADRDDSYVPTESGLEFRFAELIERSGLPAFRRQVDVGDAGWIGRVDFVHPDLPVIVEIDSALYHGSLTDRTRDEQRRERLADDGWRVVSVSGTDIFHRSTSTVAAVREAVQHARVDRAA